MRTSLRIVRSVVVIALLVSAAVIGVSTAPAPVAEAASFPDCTGDDDDNTDVDCLPTNDGNDVNAVVLGVFGSGNLTVRTSFNYPACDLYTETKSCFWSVSKPQITGCYYLKNGDPKQLESCGGSYEDFYKEPPAGSSNDHFDYTSGTATSFSGNVSQLRCAGSYSTVYAYGGDQRTDFVWRTRGPNTANCDIAVNLPVPDNLQGPSLVRVRVGGTICEADSGTNCSKSRGVSDYAWIPVSGPVPPPEPPDPPVEPESPERIVDTREGEETSDGLQEGEGLVEAGTSKEVEVAGRANVPDDAKAVIINAIAVGPDGNGYLSFYPCDEDVPTTSSLNYQRGQVVANSAIVKMSGDGDICVFSLRDVHVVVDVTGYIGADSTVVPLVPARLAESREEEETIDDESAGFGKVDAKSVTEVDVAGRGGVPDDAVAVAVNLAAVQADGNGNLRVYPCSDEPPLASNVNVTAGGTRANSAIVALSDTGSVCVYSSTSTDFILDVTAAFLDDPDFLPGDPVRLLETRPTEQTVDGQSQGAGKLDAKSTTRVQVAGRAGLPDDLDFAAVNLTAVEPDGNGYATGYPCDEDLPDTSSINFSANAIATPNSGVLKLDADGGVCIYAHESVHMVMDASAVGGDGVNP
ncbi:MAG: hypothetical protein AAFY28_14795 [Actinomycetota bacterium]